MLFNSFGMFFSVRRMGDGYSLLDIFSFKFLFCDDYRDIDIYFLKKDIFFYEVKFLY